MKLIIISTMMANRVETIETGLDSDTQTEFLAVFILEFEELMIIYKAALAEIRKINGDLNHAFFELFRVFHTLKGDSAYFPEFHEFTSFTEEMCEQLRDLDESRYHDGLLIQSLRISYARLSGALNALNRGRSMKAFRFSTFMRNF